MENKKIKLTISGKPKKSIKNFTSSKSQENRSVVIGKPQNKFVMLIITKYQTNYNIKPLKKKVK